MSPYCTYIHNIHTYVFCECIVIVCSTRSRATPDRVRACSSSPFCTARYTRFVYYIRMLYCYQYTRSEIIGHVLFPNPLSSLPNTSALRSGRIINNKKTEKKFPSPIGPRELHLGWDTWGNNIVIYKTDIASSYIHTHTQARARSLIREHCATFIHLVFSYLNTTKTVGRYWYAMLVNGENT